MVFTKPLIVLVHGAWQRAQQFHDLKQQLEHRGFIVLSPENATSGTNDSSISGKTYLDDVAVIQRAIQSPLVEGREIILVCHSYGGVPASAAVEGHQIFERQAKGLPGGIKHVVYLAAFAIPQKGISVLAALGGQYAPFMSKTGDIVALNGGAKDALFNDSDSATSIERLAECVHQSAASLETPVSFAATDVTVSKTYVACELDNALPFDVQLSLVRALGDNTNLVKVRSGHVPQQNAEALPHVVRAIEAAAQ